MDRDRRGGAEGIGVVWTRVKKEALRNNTRTEDEGGCTAEHIPREMLISSSSGVLSCNLYLYIRTLHLDIYLVVL